VGAASWPRSSLSRPGGREPQAIQLRYLETLTVIGADKNTTIVFPMPIDLMRLFAEKTLGSPSKAEHQ